MAISHLTMHLLMYLFLKKIMGIIVFVPAIISVSKNSLSKLLNIYSHLFSLTVVHFSLWTFARPYEKPHYFCHLKGSI